MIGKDTSRRDDPKWLTEDKVAFYDAITDNESAIDIMGNDSLKVIAGELLASLRANAAVQTDMQRAELLAAH